MKNKKVIFSVLFLACLGLACSFGCYNRKLSDYFTSNQIKNDLNSSTISGGGYVMDTEAFFNWEEINTTGTLMGISSQMDGVETILFSEGGWNFTFYETEYDRIYVRSQGWMSFTDFPSAGFWMIPRLVDYDYDMVALLMGVNHLDPSIGGNIYYEFLTSPNRLVIEYLDIHDTSSQLVGDFQVIFYENGTIKFQYKTVYDVFTQIPIIGLDHGDKLNFNTYSAMSSLNSTAIKFIFDEMIYPNFGFDVSIDEEHEYLLTSLNELKLAEIFGLNWEQVLGLPEDPIRSEKFKIKVNSISENVSDFKLTYDVWRWTNRFEDFSTSSDFSDSLSFKHDPLDYNMTHFLPFFVPDNTELYLTRANLTYDYSVSASQIIFSPSYSMIAYYNNLGILTDLYINSVSGIILDIQMVRTSILDPSSFKVQENDEHQWLITDLNITLMESIFGTEWEQKFGLPIKPSLNSKFKINISSVSDNSTHWKANYSIWDWKERDSEYAAFPIEDNSISYLKDAFNYTMPHNYSTIFPFFIPKPVELYLWHSNLDSSFYSIPPISPPPYTLYLMVPYDLGGNFGYGAAFYSSEGYLMDIKLILHSMPGSEITIFHLTHFDTGQKPSNVIIERGNTFNYDVIQTPENDPFSDTSNNMFKKVNITVDYVSGDDKYLNRTIVLVNHTIMDTMNTWHTNYSLHSVFFTVDNLMYIYQKSKDYLQTTTFLIRGFPFMVPTDISSASFVDLIVGSNQGVIYENGFKMILPYYFGITEYLFNYTSYGVLESFSMRYDGKEYYSVRLNSTNIDLTDRIPPKITINEPNDNDTFSTQPPEYSIL